jgi:Ca2+/Na+ antiporter
MLQYLIDFPVTNFLGAPVAELAIFILIFAYVVIRRHDKRLAGVSRLKIFVLLIIFVYFAWMPIVWPSLIPSSMLTLSVFGMFVVNFYFIYSLVLSRIEWPYRERLKNLAHEPANQEIFPPIWKYGKRFYYCYYIFQSLVSGTNPLRFLKEIATDRVRDDIKDELRQMGVKKKLISLSLMIGFMKDRLACDENLPADFKAVMEKIVDDLGKHPWLEEQVNEFLRIAAESPEDLHFPEWMSAFENSVTGK